MALVALLALAALVIGVFLLTRRGATRDGATAETDLLRMCRGDRAQAERLIEGQLQRSSGLSRAEAARRAVRAWRRDLR
jgi:hypothetical protein